MSGRNRLTDAAILKIQNYYRVAIRRNNTNELQSMNTAVWAEYFHLSSSNEKPYHGACPKGETILYKYHKSVSLDIPYDHDKHFRLPKIIMTEFKSIFRDLAKPEFLSKCLHGKTQDPK